MFESIMNIFRALLPPVIAGVVAYIAYQQHKINRDKLRLDFYEKRFQVFHSLMHLLGLIDEKRDITCDELNQFRRTTTEASFLFDNEISDYLKTIVYKGEELVFEVKGFNSLPSGNERDKKNIKITELSDFFIKQRNVSKEKFAKYLSFRQAYISKRQEINFEKGLKRLTLSLSILSGPMLYFYLPKIGVSGLSESLEFFIVLLVFEVIGFIAVWIIYLITDWIVRGFRDEKPKNEQKQ